MPERVLVAGSTGFIGSHLVRALASRGDDVHPLDADITDAAAVATTLRRVRPHVVVNLAARRGHGETADERVEQLRVSVLGTANLLEAVKESPVRRFVQAGSALEYAPSDAALRETDPVGPTSFRGVAKAAATMLCSVAELPTVVLRIFHVYGPGEGDWRLVPTLIRAALDGEEVRLTGGDARRDLVYVADVVDAVVLSLEADAVDGEIVNVGSGREATNAEVAAAVRHVSGSPLPVAAEAFPARPTDGAHRVADLSKARDLLGWRPAHTLEEGIADTLAWFREREHVRA